jgi:hypothetical protein
MALRGALLLALLALASAEVYFEERFDGEGPLAGRGQRSGCGCARAAVPSAPLPVTGDCGDVLTAMAPSDRPLSRARRGRVRGPQPPRPAGRRGAALRHGVRPPGRSAPRATGGGAPRALPRGPPCARGACSTRAPVAPPPAHAARRPRAPPPPAPRARAAGWDKRWLKSSWKKKDNAAGDWTWTAGKWYGDEAADKGIKTGPDSKFFAISSELKKPFTNDKKDLVLQVRGRAAGPAAAGRARERRSGRPGRGGGSAVAGRAGRRSNCARHGSSSPCAPPVPPAPRPPVLCEARAGPGLRGRLHQAHPRLQVGGRGEGRQRRRLGCAGSRSRAQAVRAAAPWLPRWPWVAVQRVRKAFPSPPARLDPNPPTPTPAARAR